MFWKSDVVSSGADCRAGGHPGQPGRPGEHSRQAKEFQGACSAFREIVQGSRFNVQSDGSRGIAYCAWFFVFRAQRSGARNRNRNLWHGGLRRVPHSICPEKALKGRDIPAPGSARGMQ